MIGEFVYFLLGAGAGALVIWLVPTPQSSERLVRADIGYTVTGIQARLEREKHSLTTTSSVRSNSISYSMNPSVRNAFSRSR